MSTNDATRSLDDIIQDASREIGQLWPLYSFVTNNPLQGLVDQPFGDAVARSRFLLNSRGYPSSNHFRDAFEDGLIEEELLRKRLQEAGIRKEPEQLLKDFDLAAGERHSQNQQTEVEQKLDKVVVKWLSVFLDEGRTEWWMPNRKQGFYQAWRHATQWDQQIPQPRSLVAPTTKDQAIKRVLEPHPRSNWEAIFRYHLTALPGWTGFIKQRQQRQADSWVKRYPIDLRGYMAVRLALAHHLEAQIVPPSGYEAKTRASDLDRVRECFLDAWEASYRKQLLQNLDTPGESPENDNERPRAQMVFCIDTRSEIIRRHIEQQGSYETHGFAGFFGIPVRHRPLGANRDHKSCPPPVEPTACIHDQPQGSREGVRRREVMEELKQRLKATLGSIQANVPAAFSYVELSGVVYAALLLIRTLTPRSSGWLINLLDRWLPEYEEVAAPELDDSDTDPNGIPTDQQPTGLTLDQQVDYLEEGLRSLGWTDTFAPLIVITGHTSKTVNNPYDASLECGACSGHSGTPNARMLARIGNDSTVREKLDERGISIPEDTVFLAAEHRTTTDRIRLLDGPVPPSHESHLEQLEQDLDQARQGAATERVRELPYVEYEDATEVQRRSRDWGQTRPEWGLAGNSSFVIGRTELRENKDLGGRAFLHTYDWRKDPDGDFLEGILTGPLIVCQWINHQYYFSTVDNGIFGSGTKVTQNPVGNVGVVQGNGGDLMVGLPSQSLKLSEQRSFHQPIRLSTLVEAPRERVGNLLEKHTEVRRLLINNWITLGVLDPEAGHEYWEYSSEGWKQPELLG